MEFLVPFLKEVENHLVMYSVILTEFGVAIFKENKLEKSFPFSNPVKEYLDIRQRNAKLNQIISFLSNIDASITVSDEALLALLKKESIDAQIMDEEKI